MEVTAEEMKKTFRRFYDRLEEVSPVDFDCGQLCNAACCVSDSADYDGELALYLMPGEELMYEDSDEFEVYYIDSSEIKYPHSWKDEIYLVKCINPPNCDRSIRPIQCRTFPLIPHLTKDGKFHLILDDEAFPYECPIIRDHMKLNEDFINVTYEVWTSLLSHPLVYDLVDMDSRMRSHGQKDFKIVK